MPLKPHKLFYFETFIKCLVYFHTTQFFRLREYLGAATTFGLCYIGVKGENKRGTKLNDNIKLIKLAHPLDSDVHHFVSKHT